MVTPHPVGYVESSVEAKEEQVVGGDGFCLASLGDHEELRHYGYCLQEDGKGPQDLDGRHNSSAAVKTEACWLLKLKRTVITLLLLVVTPCELFLDLGQSFFVFFFPEDPV